MKLLFGTNSVNSALEKFTPIKDATITPAAFCKSTLTHTGAVYNGSGFLINSSQREADHVWRPVNPSHVANLKISDTRDRGIYLGHAFGVFGHFILETLTALSYAVGNQLPILLHPWDDPKPDLNRLLNRSYVRKCLKALSIRETRISFVMRETKVKSLYVPPRGALMKCKVVPETLTVYQRVAEAAQAEWPDTGSKRLYLSRRLWPLRQRATNEEEIERSFCAKGFRIIYPEQMDFFEQVAIISRADIVAGIRGSNLHLTHFMREGSAVIEIAHNPMPQLRAVNDILGIETRNFFQGKISHPEGVPEPMITLDINALDLYLMENIQK